MNTEQYSKTTEFTLQRFALERAISHLPRLEALALIRALKHEDSFGSLTDAKEIYRQVLITTGVISSEDTTNE